jgi:hypothetical protein
MKATPFQLYLRCLVLGAVRPGMVSKEEARSRLGRLTGEDFGYDVGRWRVWGEEHPEVSGIWPAEESDADSDVQT